MKVVDFFKGHFNNIYKLATTKRDVIPYITIRGNINADITYNFTKSLGNVPKKNVKFLAVVIDSAGGAPAQCHIIKKKLQIWSEEKKIPIYTFTGDQAISGGYYLLTSGEKAFADGSSLVGGVGSVYKHLYLGKFLKGYDFYTEKYQTSKEPLQDRLSSMEKLNKESKNIISKILGDTKRQFIEHLKENREEKLKIDEDERDQKLYEGEIYTGKEAVHKGIIDEIGHFRGYINEHYPDAKLVDLSRISFHQRVLQFFPRFSSSFSDPSLVKLYFKSFMSQKP